MFHSRTPDLNPESRGESTSFNRLQVAPNDGGTATLPGADAEWPAAGWCTAEDDTNRCSSSVEGGGDGGVDGGGGDWRCRTKAAVQRKNASIRSDFRLTAGGSGSGDCSAG